MRPLGLDTGAPPTDTDGPVPTSHTGGPEPVYIEVVDPVFGTAGTSVTVTGGPFRESDVFLLHDVPATLLSFSESEVQVAVPQLDNDATVQVEVLRGRGGEPSEPVSFRYFASAEGSVGAVGLAGHYTHAGGYWAGNTVDYSRADVWFPVGPALEHGAWRFSPTRDSCSLDYAPTPLELYDTGLSELAFLANDDARTSFSISQGSSGGHFELQGDLSQFPSASPADLQTTGPSTSGWPSFAVPAFIGKVGAAFVVTQPPIMGAARPRVSAGFSLQWGGPYEGEVLVTLIRRRWNPSAGAYEYQETVTCWLEDDGAHEVPDLWTDWATPAASAFDAVDIVVGRVWSPPATLPHNRGRSGVLGGTFIIGNAVAQ